MSQIYPAGPKQPVFKVINWHHHREMPGGWGFVFEMGVGKDRALALTSLSSLISPDGRDTYICHKARFEGHHNVQLTPAADNTDMDFALVFLNRRDIEKVTTPVSLSFDPPTEKGAPIKCLNPAGSISTSCSPPLDNKAGLDHIPFAMMVPADYRGSPIEYAGKTVGLVGNDCGARNGMIGGPSIRGIFKFLYLWGKGLAVHPDDRKYNLPPEIAASINRIAEENLPVSSLVP